MRSRLFPRHIFIIGSILAALSGSALKGQDPFEQIVHMHFDSITLPDFMAHVEKEFGVSFHYNPTYLETGSWSKAHFSGVMLKEALRSFFAHWNMNIYLRDHAVYVTENLSINPRFATEFLQRIRAESAAPTFSNNNVESLERETGTDRFAEFEVTKFGVPSASRETQRFRIQGKVSSRETGEPVIGVTLQVSGTGIGTATDAAGSYELILPAGVHEITVRAIGKQTTYRQVSLYDNGELPIQLAQEITEIEEVVVVGKADDKINTMVGAEKLDLALVKKSVLVMGESDILKGILALPGVQTITEVSNGFNVRGGSTDQNLVLIDEVPVMNSSHFFGFFSSFNADIVEDATLYKSGIPANQGGRISSILEVNSKKGNKKRFEGTGGISPVTARLAVEGPLVRNKLSFIAGGRSTYSDWLMNQVSDPRINNSSAYFYDGFLNLHADLPGQSSLSASLYHSKDYFDFDEFLTHRYSNLAGSLILESSLGKHSTYRGALTYSDFGFSLTDKYNPATAARSSYSILQYGLKNKFTWQHSRWINLTYGVDAIYYLSAPGRVEPAGESSLVVPVVLREEQALEIAPYIQNKQQLTRWLAVSYGIRFSHYTVFGPDSVYLYEPGTSRSLNSLNDTVWFRKREAVVSYHGPEIRFLARFKTGNTSSVKLSYNRMRQYIHLISNTITPAPTDIWKLSDTYFLPQAGNQVSLGYFRDLVKKTNNILTVSLEGYYKFTDHILDYKTGATLFANAHFETEILEGQNRSYGLEAQINKEGGSLYGWINYTWARSLNQFYSSFPEETINRGAWYPSNHDKPHQLKAVLNYDFYRRLSLSANLNYSTGRPVTLPVTSFQFGGKKRVQFSDRNLHRMPDYFRLDISATLDGRYNVEKLAHGSFTLSIVNVTGRKNPYSVFFQYDEKGKLKAYYLSIFGVPIATLTYNLRF